LQSKTNTVETEQTDPEAAPNRRKQTNNAQNGELRFYGTQGIVMIPSAMCEKLDKMFGSGAEAIVHYMLFESGRVTFDNMMKHSQDKSRGELLKALVDLQPCTGWGYASLTIARADPPTVQVSVRNPPVKTLKGSQKHMIGSFWAGALSVYFNRQLLSKNLGYSAEKDEFTCTISV
jgi:hypothetical protein